jgi:pyrophosphatase PpaX
MKYTHLLFDWDGCLAKTLEVWLEAYRINLQKRGVDAEDYQITHHFGDWELGKHFGVADFQEFNEEAATYARKKLKEVELYSGAKETIKLLHKTHKLAVLSSASRDILVNGIKHNELEGYFDLIISGEDVANHKPHPEVIENAVTFFNTTKNDVIMIGDSRKDIGAANNAAVDSILVYPKSHELFYSLEQLQTLKPTYTVTSVSDIPHTIL